jgi:cob(I)alamin adenosyltransferase
MKLDRGLVQVYTGDGKGKTTAALGQAFRSAGNGLRIYMVQFLKTDDTGELHSVKKFYPDFQIFRFEKPKGFFWTLSDEEKAKLKVEIRNGFNFCKKTMENGACDILILDEILGVLGNGLLSADELLDFLKSKPDNMEIVMTGREAPEVIVAAADLVTEMKEIKHYYSKGIAGRKGIEF